MKEDDQATSHKWEKIEATPYSLRSMLFLSHGSMEIDTQKERSKLIGKEYENGERKKSIEKAAKNNKLKGSKRMHIEGAERKPFNEKLNGTTKDVVKVFGYQEHSL